MKTLIKNIFIGMKNKISRYVKNILLNKKYGPATKYYFNQANIHIGDETYGIPQISFSNSGASLYIGKYCSIASKVTIMLGGLHHQEWITTYPFYHKFSQMHQWDHIENLGDKSPKDTIIGNDVWLGSEVLVLPGVEIGNGAIIGARSVVSKNIPPYAIAVGSPIQIIRKRFSEEQIDALLKIKWWEWPVEKINDAIPFLTSSQIDNFINKNFLDK